MAYGLLQRHAAMLAFVDDFWLMGLTFLSLIPLMFLMKKSPAARSAYERALSAPDGTRAPRRRERNGSIGVIKQAQGSREYIELNKRGGSPRTGAG